MDAATGWAMKLPCLNVIPSHACSLANRRSPAIREAELEPRAIDTCHGTYFAKIFGNA
jgi:hypothetical protein